MTATQNGMQITQAPDADGHDAYDVLSKSGNTYHVRYEGMSGTYDDDPEYDAGTWSCTCPAYTYRRDCTHIAAVTAHVDGDE